jgi:hypothetical protein
VPVGIVQALYVELFVSNGESRDHGGLVRDMPLLPLPLHLVKPLADEFCLWAQAFQTKLRQDAKAQAIRADKLLTISLKILNAHKIKVTFLHQHFVSSSPAK